MTDKQFLQRAIEKAVESVAQGGFPAGAIIVKDGEVVGEGISIGNKVYDPTAHAEIASIREACKGLSTTLLSGSTLYASMQPCLMCLGASMWGGITKIVFACSKDMVSDKYYGGSYELSDSNKELTSPIELVHFAELEEESLAVIRDWEKSR